MRKNVKPHYFQCGGQLPAYMGQQFQHGGLLPVFIGQRYQHGDGLGDILRGIWRTVFPIFAPIAAKTAASFISSAGKNIEEGKGFKDSLKGAFHDTKGTALQDVAGGIKNAVSAFSNAGQAGSGIFRPGTQDIIRKRKRRRAKSRGIAKRRKVEHKIKRRRVYKGGKKRRSKKYSRQVKSNKTTNF